MRGDWTTWPSWPSGYLTRIRRYFYRRSLQANAQLIGNSLETISAVHKEHFPHADLENFCLIWCEMAGALGVRPSALQLERKVEAPELTIDQLEDLHYVLTRESRGLPPPSSPIRTVGDFLGYLYPQDPG